MGRKKAPNASCLDLTTLGHSDGSSIASTCSAYQFHNGAEEVEADEFSTRVEELFEKRGSTREKALEALVVSLRVEHRPEDCMMQQDTLLSRCLSSVRRGGPVESSLAATLVGLYILTIGEQNESLLRSVQLELERTGREGAPQVACSALEALAVAVFVAGEDEEHTIEVMAKLRSLWRKGDARVAAAAVRCWSFLFTTITSPLSAGLVEGIMADLATLLRHMDSDLRAAAGGGAALLYDTNSSTLESVMEEEEEDYEYEYEGDGQQLEEVGDTLPASTSSHLEDDHHEHGNGNGHGNGCAGDSGSAGASSSMEAGLGEVIDLMRGLAANHKGEGPRRKRRDRAALRATFRGLVALLGPGAQVAQSRVKLQHGDSVSVEGLQANTQLDFIRRFLAGGFQTHMQANPFLHQLFDFKPRTTKPDKLTAAERKAQRSATEAAARSRQSHRRGERAAKHAGMDAY